MLFTVVEDVKTLTDKMLEKGATLTQSGHFYVQNKPPSRSQGNVMLAILVVVIIIGPSGLKFREYIHVM